MKRGTWILLAAVVALAALVLLWERKLPTTGESQQAERRLLPSWASKATAVQREGFEPLSLRQGAGAGWELAAPVADRADGQSVSGFLEFLAGAEVTRWVEGAPPADAGLEAPRATWTLSGEGGRCTVGLGALAPLGSGLYLRVDSRTALVPASLEEVLLRPLDDFRAKELLAAASGDVTSLRLSEGAAVRLALRRDGDLWSLSAPFADAADRYRVENLLDDLCACLVDSVASDAPGDLAAYGLEPPWREVRLSTAKGEVIVALGAPVPGSDPAKALRYARASDRPSVFHVSMNSLRSLEGDPESLRSLALFGHDPYGAQSLAVAGPATLTLSADAQGRWTSAAPPAGARAEDGGPLFTALTALRGTRAVAAGDPAAAAFSPVLTLTLRGEGWEERVEVGAGRDGLRLARPAGRPVLLELAGEEWQAAQAALDVATGKVPAPPPPAPLSTPGAPAP